MGFRVIRNSARTPSEQRYIWSTLEIWKRLPEPRRQELRGLIGEIADTAPEGRALYDVLVRARTPQAVSAVTGVSLQRIYEMRREFYDRCRI